MQRVVAAVQAGDDAAVRSVSCLRGPSAFFFRSSHHLQVVYGRMICAVMPFESANPVPPPIRGVLRTELIRDLALGEQTYELLASKYGRSHQAVKQFAARNADEIRRAKQALVADPKDEYAGVAIAKKWYRVADADQDLAHIEERLQDPNLTDTQRKGYLNLKSKLRREVAEERGELPSRIAIESDSPLMRYEIVGLDMATVFAEDGTAGLGASDAVQAGSSSVSEGHMSRDERVRSYVERKAGPVPESAPSVPASEVPEPSATSPGEVSDPRLKSWLNS